MLGRHVVSWLIAHPRLSTALRGILIAVLFFALVLSVVHGVRVGAAFVVLIVALVWRRRRGSSGQPS